MNRKCGTYREKMNIYRVQVGKPEGERPLKRPGRRCENNTRIKTDIR
jgi:hypothetical protein